MVKSNLKTNFHPNSYSPVGRRGVVLQGMNKSCRLPCGSFAFFAAEYLPVLK